MNADVIKPGGAVKLAPKISLKVFFGFTTLAAFAVYFVPIKYSATCDYLGQGRYISTIMNDTVDIQGRNLTQSFENVVLNVSLISAKRASNPRCGGWDIEFRTNLYNYAKLKRYGILRFRDSR